jgi:hypothetical protein
VVGSSGHIVHHQNAKEFLMAAASGCGICVQIKQKSRVDKRTIVGFQGGGSSTFSSFNISNGLNLLASNGATLYLFWNHISIHAARELKANIKNHLRDE